MENNSINSALEEGANCARLPNICRSKRFPGLRDTLERRHTKLFMQALKQISKNMNHYVDDTQASNFYICHKNGKN